MRAKVASGCHQPVRPSGLAVPLFCFASVYSKPPRRQNFEDVGSLMAKTKKRVKKSALVEIRLENRPGPTRQTVARAPLGETAIGNYKVL